MIHSWLENALTKDFKHGKDEKEFSKDLSAALSLNGSMKRTFVQVVPTDVFINDLG